MKKTDYVSLYKSKKSYKVNENDIPTENDSLVIGCIDIPITTKCTLKCKNCSSLMPYYKETTIFDIDYLINSINALFSVVDKIIRVNVLGGEPFIHPKLDLIIKALNKDRVKKVYIITNGTIVPTKKELLDALKQENVEVRVSNYLSISSKIEKIKTVFEQNKIKYTIKQFGENDFNWFNFGDFKNRNRTKEELDSQFVSCDVEWGSYLKGKLYPCPRSAHADDLSLIPHNENNYIDILELSNDKEMLRKILEEFITRKDSYPCCNYCNRGTNLCEKVKVAEQE